MDDPIPFNLNSLFLQNIFHCHIPLCRGLPTIPDILNSFPCSMTRKISTMNEKSYINKVVRWVTVKNQMTFFFGLVLLLLQIITEEKRTQKRIPGNKSDKKTLKCYCKDGTDKQTKPNFGIPNIMTRGILAFWFLTKR